MDLAAENKELRAENAKLQQRIKELEAMLGQNSRNSNWPSSRDKSRQKKRTGSLRQKSDKKAGGQERHKGQTLKMSADPEHVHTIVQRDVPIAKRNLSQSKRRSG